MIDLGDELADFNEPTNFGDPTRKPGYPVGRPAPGGGSITPLADLQASGFNTTPPDGFVNPQIVHHSTDSWSKVVAGLPAQDFPYHYVILKDGEVIPTNGLVIPDGFEEIGRIDD
jgi:hypothetical protein